MASKRLQLKTNNMFGGWPVIDYDDVRMQKLTTLISMPEFVRKNTQLFFSYTIKDHEDRPDIVARSQYGDSKLDWVILFTNHIVDPSFEWPMSGEVFEQFLVDKYGSVAAAQAETMFYQQNSEQSSISVAQYNALSVACQKYWLPRYDYIGNLKEYVYVDNSYEISSGGYLLLDSAERDYWNEISAYDYEVNRNNNNKIIRLISPAYIDRFISEYNRLLKQ